MNLRRTLQVAWEGLTLNKARSFLATLGVIIGVAAVIVMLAVSAGAEAEIADYINSLGPNLILVYPGKGRGKLDPGSKPVQLSYDDIVAIGENVSGINGVAAQEETMRDVVVVGTAALEDIPIVGTTTDFPQVRDYQVELGRFLTDQDNERASNVAVLGYDVAGELFGNASTALGQNIRIGSTQFTVVGVMEEKGAATIMTAGCTSLSSATFIPLPTPALARIECTLSGFRRRTGTRSPA